MYENMTYENLLASMLAYATAQAEVREEKLDTREGSMLWYGQAPAAVEAQNLFIQLDTILQETFADTASRPYLLLRAKERGLYPKAASYAIGKAVCNPPEVRLTAGTRFSLNDLHYRVTERISAGQYRVQCETIGEAGNAYLGTLIPVEYIKGLQSVELVEILIPGEEEQGTESFRKAYLDSFDVQAFGGNIADYQKKVMALQGVGAVKVYPVWNGGGTVKLVLLDSTFARPNKALLEEVQTAIDPEKNQGEGKGIAPIGHTVTVAGAINKSCNLSMKLSLAEDADSRTILAALREAFAAYLLELRKSWAESEALTVRISYLESRALDVEGVIDIQDCCINGAGKNWTLAGEEIPVLGEIEVRV